MASAYWRTNHRVENLLHEQDVDWDFLQLVRLLLSINSDKSLVDDESLLDTLSKKVRFIASLAADFAPGEVREIKDKGIGKPIDISLVNGVLSASNGPLPEPFVDWLRRTVDAGDAAMADFLNLFNNRLMALRYLFSRTLQPNLLDASANDSEYGLLLESLSGALFNRQPQTADLRLTGLLANNRLSFPVAKQLLRFSLGLNLSAMNSYQGGWLNVDKQDHSILGKRPLCELGKTATLGTKVWDQQKAIEWIFGPVDWQQVKSLMPDGERYQQFKNLLNRITDCRCDSIIVLLIPKRQLPDIKLMDGLIKDVSSISDKDAITDEKMLLGLTTVLPTSKKRIKGKDLIKITFTIETSNPNV